MISGMKFRSAGQLISRNFSHDLNLRGEIYTRYLEARKAYGNELTKITRIREEKGLKGDEVNKLFEKADQEYGEILKTIFGMHYNEIIAELEVFQQEIQGINNEGDYEIGLSL